jgi:hypothetical protein
MMMVVGWEKEEERGEVGGEYLVRKVVEVVR